MVPNSAKIVEPAKCQQTLSLILKCLEPYQTSLTTGLAIAYNLKFLRGKVRDATLQSWALCTSINKYEKPP